MCKQQEATEILFQNDRTQFGEQYYCLLIDQYKLYVEMADRISARRDSANNLFLGLMTLLITVIGVCYFNKSFNLIYVVCAVGIVFCCVWFSLISSYRKLNSGKFKIIHLIEERLPVRSFDAGMDDFG